MLKENQIFLEVLVVVEAMEVVHEEMMEDLVNLGDLESLEGSGVVAMKDQSMEVQEDLRAEDLEDGSD